MGKVPAVVRCGIAGAVPWPRQIDADSTAGVAGERRACTRLGVTNLPADPGPAAAATLPEPEKED